MEKISSWVENKVLVNRFIQHLSQFVVMATWNIHKYWQKKKPPPTTEHSHHSRSMNVCVSDNFK